MKKNILKYIGGIFTAALALTACSPEDFNGADPNGLPTVEGRSIEVSVDQETNTMVANTKEVPGTYLIWYIDGKHQTSLPTVFYSNKEAGTHEIELKVGNRNGISQASLKQTFTFNETKIDYTKYFDRLCGKEWRIDYTLKGHMGCGEPGTDGSNWWSAGPNDKADWGVYDDRVTFGHTDADPASGGSYTYNPGEGGTVYVNTGCSVFSEFNTNDGNDFMATVSPQNSTFTIYPGKYQDEDVFYLQFAEKTLLPYIPNDQTYNNPVYRIEGLTNSQLALVCDNGDISWRLVFTSKEDTGMPDDPTDEDVMDWDINSPANLWKPVEEGSAFISVTPWFANDGWAQIGDPEWNHTGDTWEVVIPEGMGGSQWQGQFPINTTLTASKDKKYNFYCVVEADNDCPGVTIKLTETDDAEKHDNNFFFDGRHTVEGGKPFIYKAKNVTLPLNDAHALSLFFDLGGTPAGTHVKVSKIYLEEAVSMDYNDANNLWKSVDDGSAFISVTPWFANDGWAQIGDPEWSHNGNVWELDIPEGMGGNQWQGQFPINTTLAVAQNDAYNFSCTIEADNDCPGVTIKLTETDDAEKHDDNFYFDGRHAVSEGVPFVYTMKGVTLPKNDAHALSLFFDFGGTPVGTHIKISNIIFEKVE